MNDSPGKQALFEGLVFNEEGELAAVDRVGGEPFYVVLDADFRRYVEAGVIDHHHVVMVTGPVEPYEHRSLAPAIRVIVHRAHSLPALAPARRLTPAASRPDTRAFAGQCSLRLLSRRRRPDR